LDKKDYNCTITDSPPLSVIQHSKATNALLNGLSDTIFTKFAHCKSTKEIWDKLQNIYEGDTKVKEAKL
jgi:hypothetical protein